MFDIRFKQIEIALADGRLDEAWQILRDPDIRTHKWGQKSLTRLADAYLKRCREHLDANRLAAAMEDCTRAQNLAGNRPDTADLMSKICKAMDATRQESQQQAQRLAQAQDQINRGWLSAGRRILDGCEDGRSEGLLKQAEFAEASAESATKRIELALECGNIADVARLYQSAAASFGGVPQLSKLKQQILTQAVKRVRTLLQDGQLQPALALLGAFGRLTADWNELYTLNQAVVHCCKGGQWMRNGHYRQGIIELKKAQLLVGTISWLNQAIEQAGQVVRIQEGLEVSPLGLLDADKAEVYESPSRGVVKPVGSAGIVPEKKVSEMTQEKRLKYLLQIDGVGCHVLFCADSITMGPISSSHRPQLGFVVSPDGPIKRIERLDGDYFISDCGNATGRKHLLSEGDKIDLSPRCRMKFTQPNPASGTACLVFSSGKLARSDVQSAILVDRELLIGPGRGCHIQSGAVNQTLTLLNRGGRLYYQGHERMVCGQNPMESTDAIPMNQSVQIGQVRMTLTDFTG